MPGDDLEKKKAKYDGKNMQMINKVITIIWEGNSSMANNYKLDHIIVDTIDGAQGIEKKLKDLGVSVNDIIDISVVNGSHWVFFKTRVNAKGEEEDMIELLYTFNNKNCLNNLITKVQAKGVNFKPIKETMSFCEVCRFSIWFRGPKEEAKNMVRLIKHN